MTAAGAIVDIRSRDKEGKSALDLAKAAGHDELVALLEKMAEVSS
jgi:ankyrin repeat protein